MKYKFNNNDDNGATGSRSNSFIFQIKCGQCGNQLDDQIMVAKECLHRFCSSCVPTTLASNKNHSCPQCRATVTFKLDSNFSRLISKINHNNNKSPIKRRIVDVLHSERIDLASQHNGSSCGGGRWSRMTATCSPTKQSKSSDDNSPPKLGSPHLLLGPSTSAMHSSEFGGEHMEGEPVNKKAIKHPTDPMTSDRRSDGEYERWSKNNGNLMCYRMPLNRNLSHMNAIVLWPDGTNYRNPEIPQCLLRPRYLYVPPIATVAHLIEYLFKRAELEAGAKLRFEYHIQIMPVEDERDEINLWVNPMRDIDYLSIEFKSNLQDSNNTGEYVLILRKNQEDSYFCTNLIMTHPFRPLWETVTVAELLQARTLLALAHCGRQTARLNNAGGTTNVSGIGMPMTPSTAAAKASANDPATMTDLANYQKQQREEAEKRPPKFVFRFVAKASSQFPQHTSQRM